MKVAVFRRSVTMEEVFEVSVVDEDDADENTNEEQASNRGNEAITLVSSTTEMPGSSSKAKAARPTNQQQQQPCSHCGCVKKSREDQDEDIEETEPEQRVETQPNDDQVDSATIAEDVADLPAETDHDHDHDHDQASAPQPTLPKGVKLLPKWQIRNTSLNPPTMASAAERAKMLKRGYDGTLDPWCSKKRKVTLQTPEGPIDVTVIQHKALKLEDGSDKYKCPVPDCSYTKTGSRVFISKHFSTVHKDYRSWRDVFLNKDAPQFVVREDQGQEDPRAEVASVDSNDALEDLVSSAVSPDTNMANSPPARPPPPPPALPTAPATVTWTQTASTPICTPLPRASSASTVTPQQQYSVVPDLGVALQPQVQVQQSSLSSQPMFPVQSPPLQGVPMALVPLHQIQSGHVVINPHHQPQLQTQPHPVPMPVPVPVSAPMYAPPPGLAPASTLEPNQKYKIIQVMVPARLASQPLSLQVTPGRGQGVQVQVQGSHPPIVSSQAATLDMAPGPAGQQPYCAQIVAPPSGCDLLGQPISGLLPVRSQPMTELGSHQLVFTPVSNVTTVPQQQQQQQQLLLSTVQPNFAFHPHT